MNATQKLYLDELKLRYRTLQKSIAHDDLIKVITREYIDYPDWDPVVLKEFLKGVTEEC